jgi:formate dehydrogenase (coenzyme F420) alpha subunit
MGNERKQIKSLCRMCDDHCGINVYVDEQGQVVNIDGSNHYWNRGRLCVKGRSGVDFVNHPDRILKPLKKIDGKFVEIELEQALDEIAKKMSEITEKHGARANSIWKGEAVGFAQEEELARRFIHAIGSPNYFSNDSQCFVGRWIGYSLVAGSWMAQPDFENSRCIVLWGANPPSAHPNMTQYIMNAKEKGAKIIAIDSRLSNIARQADIFAQIRPGTDGALALGIIKILIEEKIYNQHFVEHYTTGFDKLKDYVQKFSKEFVCQETGISEDILNDIVEAIHFGKSQVVNYVGNGLEHHENGINNIRAVACIDALIASFDQKGGNFMPEGFGPSELTLYHEKPLTELEPIGADKFPVLYEYRKECHTMTAMDTIITEKPYALKSMIIIGANPVLTNPNTNKVIEALSKLELLVVRELFMTETAELADYILPAASYLERSELHYHGMHQVATLTNRIQTIEAVQDEYMFLHDLAHRLGAGEYFPWENEDRLNEWLVEPSGVTIETLKAHPEGYQYKPLQYKKWEAKEARGEKPFNTRTGKVELFSQYLEDMGYDGLPVYHSPDFIANPDSEYPYTMITGARKMIYYHSRNKNFKRFLTAVPRAELELHPHDAKNLGITDGDLVRVTSQIGSVEVHAVIKHEREIMPGIIQFTHGWKEANVNLITHDDKFDPIDGFPLMKAVKVKIEKI